MSKSGATTRGITSTTYAGNRIIYNAAYAASNTFTLAATPTKIYAVLVYNATTGMNNPFAAYTWTAGSNTVTITDTLVSGDTVYFDVELSPVTFTQNDDSLLYAMMF